jgi:putative endonuclease
MRHKDELGRWGEDVAADHLRRSGLIVLERNWRCPIGEIDIVARDHRQLIVCEVKTRSGLGFGSPLEAVTEIKAQRLGRLAAAWLASHSLSVRAVRIDVIGVLRRHGADPVIDHIKGVI